MDEAATTGGALASKSRLGHHKECETWTNTKIVVPQIDRFPTGLWYHRRPRPGASRARRDENQGNGDPHNSFTSHPGIVECAISIQPSYIQFQLHISSVKRAEMEEVSSNRIEFPTLYRFQALTWWQCHWDWIRDYVFEPVALLAPRLCHKFFLKTQFHSSALLDTEISVCRRTELSHIPGFETSRHEVLLSSPIDIILPERLFHYGATGCVQTLSKRPIIIANRYLRSQRSTFNSLNSMKEKECWDGDAPTERCQVVCNWNVHVERRMRNPLQRLVSSRA